MRREGSEPLPRQTPENKEKTGPRHGIDVVVHNYWIRHAQKQSGEIFNAGKTGISHSSISEGGATQAEMRGGGMEWTPYTRQTSQ